MNARKRQKTSQLLSNPDGFTMVEVMLAISLFSIGFLALTAVTVSSSNTSRSTVFSDRSVLAGQEMMEMLSIVDMNHVALNDGNHQPVMNNSNAEYAHLGFQWDIIDSVDPDSDGTDDFKTIALGVVHNGELKLQSFYRRQIN